tara:strand:- start:982 stop:1206 length:225 start_codon:yes stop_codon:yes gene_type:complete
MKTTIYQTVLLLFSIFTISSCSVDDQQSTPPDLKAKITKTYIYNSDEKEVLNLINDYRLNEGLNALELQDHILV